MGISGKPWTDAEVADLQRQCDAIFAPFVTFMKSQRPALDDQVLAGGVYSGREAVTVGLADATAPGLNQFLAALLS